MAHLNNSPINQRVKEGGGGAEYGMLDIVETDSESIPGVSSG